MRLFLALCPLAIALVAGCSSVQPIGGGTYSSIPSSQCNVTVYATESQARQFGEIEELCFIEGTSSGSFVHTPATAIAKHKDKACSCGAENVYVQSRQPMGMGVASASMVAFRYVQRPQVEAIDDTYQKARSCQDRGGLWISDKCLIEID